MNELISYLTKTNNIINAYQAKYVDGQVIKNEGLLTRRELAKSYKIAIHIFEQNNGTTFTS